MKKINKEQLPKRNLVHDKLAHGKKKNSTQAKKII